MQAPTTTGTPPPPSPYRGANPDDFAEDEVRALAIEARALPPSERYDLLSHATAVEGELVRFPGTVQISLLGLVALGGTERAAYDSWITVALSRLGMAS